ncbi:hypothetical protein [Mycolicibacterium sp. P9-22]|uniref:hypothetical protein n=1 Tax=Mycolicibacterium sp. P9-22 TaxID=2024613 RepID=UPI001D13E71C|nr:hypothetical protein [Mycolicibacterium sp. P9-22]
MTAIVAPAAIAADYPMIDGIPVFPLFGSDPAGGFHTQGDVLVDKTRDGISLDQLWQDYRDLLGEVNKHRSAIVSHLAHTTTAVADAVPQSVEEIAFEEASEFGKPKAARPGSALLLGYDFRDYDVASRYTWKFLRDASRQQVDHVTESILEANNRNTTRQVLKRIFSPTESLSPENHKVFGLWTGDDGLAPLPHLGRTFPESTSHYWASGNAVLDSADIEDAITAITQKGYGRTARSRILVFANQVETDKIAMWKSGEESRTGGPVAKFDFIPSADAPPYLTDKTIVGATAPADLDGLRIVGSYGDAWVIPTEILPAGYVLVVASGGPDSPNNALGYRIHHDPTYQGLLLIPGPGRYPLQEAHYVNSFGVGVRNRSAAVCIQITSGSTYTAPTWPV